MTLDDSPAYPCTRCFKLPCSCIVFLHVAGHARLAADLPHHVLQPALATFHVVAEAALHELGGHLVDSQEVSY